MKGGLTQGTNISGGGVYMTELWGRFGHASPRIIRLWVSTSNRL